MLAVKNIVYLVRERYALATGLGQAHMANFTLLFHQGGLFSTCRLSYFFCCAAKEQLARCAEHIDHVTQVIGTQFGNHYPQMVKAATLGNKLAVGLMVFFQQIFQQLAGDLKPVTITVARA